MEPAEDRAVEEPDATGVDIRELPAISACSPAAGLAWIPGQQPPANSHRPGPPVSSRPGTRHQ